jgi:hypothetical protein
MRRLVTGRLKFDRDLLLTFEGPETASGSLSFGYSGCEPFEGTGGRPPSDQIGFLHTPGTFYAMGFIDPRPDAGTVVNPTFSEPPLGWNKRGGVVRYPKTCFFQVSGTQRNWGDIAERLPALAQVLREAGVTVVLLTGGQAPIGFRPFMGMIPTTGVYQSVVDGTGDSPAEFKRHVFTHPEPDLIVGGDLLYVSLEGTVWSYGCASHDTTLPDEAGARASPTTYVTGSEADPVVAPAGSVAFDAGSDNAVLAWTEESAEDIARFEDEYLDRFRSYRHLIVHPLDYEPAAVTLDHEAIYAAFVGNADFVRRRLVTPADRDAVWEAVAEEVMSFFGIE